MFLNFMHISSINLEYPHKYYNFETVTIMIDVINIMKNSFFFLELYEEFASYENQIITLE